jgi:hypothetical protein
MLKVFLGLLLSLPVNAKSEKYIAKLGEYQNNQELMEEVRKWGVDNEYLDPREKWIFSPQYLKDQQNYVTTCRTLRERYEDLHDAPPLGDSNRYPSGHDILQKLAFNRTFEEHLEMQKLYAAGQQEWYEKALEETHTLNAIWSAMAAAQQEWNEVHRRRENMKFVMQQIGEKDYWSARFPPHVPTWRCRVLD